MEDFYDLLGVSENAPAEEIDRAWRDRVRTYHPDVNDDARANAQFKTLKAAHEVLSSEEKRAAYDRLGHETYVRERLGGLPTAGQPGPDAIDEDDEGDESDDATEGPKRESKRSTDATGNAGASGTRSGGARSDRTGSGGGSQTGHPGGTSRTSTASGQSQSAGGSGRSTTAGRTANRDSTARRGLTRLQYGWLGVLLAGTVYLAGLWQYLGANAAAVGSFREAVAADPIGALTATRLLAPGTFALRTISGAAAPGPELLFPVGAVALAVAFLAVVSSFGRGSAYLYLVGGLAPVAALAVGPVVALSDGVVLALVAAVPIGATLLFAVDVGRYAAR
ncbi:J domain-containing protein [Halobellus rubicundus]|uniref:J domain-containing protein n=1 Tax=Halobellus rubicundus TaxID=2996466 RepID=A0ABD5MA66_9EURY